MFSTKKFNFTEEEQDTLEYFIKNIPLQHEEKISSIEISMIESLVSQWHQPSVAKFAAASEIVRRFFDTNTTLHKAWTEQLIENNTSNAKTQGTPYFTIKARDGSETHSVFHHYLSDYYISLFDAPRNEEQSSPSNKMFFLDQACSYGSYIGIGTRAMLNVEKIKKLPSFTNENGDKLIAAIKTDTDRLCQLYSATGYIRAACVWLRLAKSFLASDDQTVKDRGSAMFEEGIKNLLCAYLLKDDEDSNHLLKVITKGKGPFSLISIQTNDKVESWEDAKNAMREWIGDQTTFETIMTRAKAEVVGVKSELSTLRSAMQKL